ncbi:MAG: 1,2-diacylglycerol 3-beta-glucosyltransferase [Acidimicrobiaceae bacterium]|jgi:cellulose synthase/poly-beta-1,6-N-acetylglucosamine synthase-like glycosyltransferase|nr:1,2-diacylglycerol 3-beta-glucosyltransferase [Acidimicrobiaceae bacterium]
MLSILIGVLSLVLIGTGLFYFIATTGFGMIEGRRLRREAPATDGASGLASLARPTDVYFLVPCLNEEGVIGSTLNRLLSNPEARVVVVDDASQDRTAQVVRSVGGDRTLLISRTLPDAQKGKGPALNAGLPAIVADVRGRGLDPSQVLVCVMDADGDLSDGALGHVLPLFDDPKVGGAQLGVRISNREENLLTTMQDFEFWGLAATAQLGRVRLGTVSLGGNGQFTRLSALSELGAAPWSTALTEDLDLALRLMERGWRLTTTPLASVHQQAVLTFPALIRQRTRWFQGHMACIGHLRKLWGSAAMSNLSVLEVSAYLLIPWVFILPWSILFHIGLWQLLGRLASAPKASIGGNGVIVRVATLIAWYLLGFGPSLFGGYLYYRQDRSVGRLRAMLLGHALVLCNYVAFVSCWLAALRSLRGLTGWEKTVRRTEGGLDYLLPSNLVAASGRVIGRLTKRPPDVRPSPAPARSGDSPSGALLLRFGTPEPALPSHTPTPVAATPVRVKAIVSHNQLGAAASAPGAKVRARVTRCAAPSAPSTPAATPLLTGRLRVTPRPFEPNDEKLNQFGARFLIRDVVPVMVTPLQEETA